MIWQEDVDETAPSVRSQCERVDLDDLDELDDGRCKASSCHANRLHKDEFGNVFAIDPDGKNFKSVRYEKET